MRIRDNDIGVLRLAETGFNAFANALGRVGVDNRKIVEWCDLDDDTQFGWMAVADQAISVLEDCEGLPWVRFAEILFDSWARRMEFSAPSFHDLPDINRAAWVAVSRHLANVLALEEDEDLSEHENRWLNAAVSLLNTRSD